MCQDDTHSTPVIGCPPPLCFSPLLREKCVGSNLNSACECSLHLLKPLNYSDIFFTIMALLNDPPSLSQGWYYFFILWRCCSEGSFQMNHKVVESRPVFNIRLRPSGLRLVQGSATFTIPGAFLTPVQLNATRLEPKILYDLSKKDHL